MKCREFLATVESLFVGLFFRNHSGLDSTHVTCAALLAGLGLLGLPVDAAEIEQPPAADVTLDEVTVTAMRLRLAELRENLTRLEEQIYARYNDLNKVDKYDILCSDYTRTGTHLSQRYCRPQFEEDARNEEGQVAFRSWRQVHDPYAPMPAASVEIPESPVPKILAKVPAFQEHMRQVMEKDPQLRRWLRERAEAAEEFERTRRELFAR